MNNDEYTSWIKNHPSELFDCFKANLKNNVFAFPVFLEYQKKKFGSFFHGLSGAVLRSIN